MIELISSNIRFPFMKYRWPMVIFSLAVLALSFVGIFKKGFNYGVDFAGGVQIVFELPANSGVDAERLRAGLEASGVEGASVQSFGTAAKQNDNQFIVHFPAEFLDETQTGTKLESSLKGLKTSSSANIIQKFKFVGIEKAYLTLTESVKLDQLKAALQKTDFGMLSFVDVTVFGRESQNEYQILFLSIGETVTQKLATALKLPEGQVLKALKVDFVGAKVGGDLRISALLSLIITTILIFVYIFVRFDFMYAPGVIIALVHDVSLVAGYFAWTGLEFDLTIVAALLTLAGYSINDTIIVFDRIREVASQMKGKNFIEIINIAISQTLGRTIITSGTVFLATLALWYWGGPVIHGFATAFLIGVIVGTYSSVFIASPSILWMRRLLKVEGRQHSRAAA